MKIIKAIVVSRQNHTDACYLHMALPNPCWPYTGPLSLRFDTPPDQGEAYITKHFGVTPEVIQVV